MARTVRKTTKTAKRGWPVSRESDADFGLRNTRKTRKGAGSGGLACFARRRRIARSQPRERRLRRAKLAARLGKPSRACRVGGGRRASSLALSPAADATQPPSAGPRSMRGRGTSPPFRAFRTFRRPKASAHWALAAGSAKPPTRRGSAERPPECVPHGSSRARVTPGRLTAPRPRARLHRRGGAGGRRPAPLPFPRGRPAGGTPNRAMTARGATRRPSPRRGPPGRPAE